ncbi:MAG: hypothetical protein HUU41_22795 [Bryobacteraceae bacterium]|nr:hypothetical protein [Bryobacterales bacterium]MEB2363339.1 hypothetical protein [Bryobacterales bacterium]NUN03943.1 hypothetical protein [Bryobacteraceae bacterium]
MHNLTRSTLTEFFPEETALRLKAPAADPSCRTDPDSLAPPRVIGEGSVQGFFVVKLLRETPGATEEFWKAPDLDCERLYSKLEVKSSTDGSTFMVAEKITESVSSGEPSPDLFVVPTSFREVPPSTLVQESAAIEGAPLCDEVRGKLPDRDKRYLESRKFQPQ